MKKDQLDRWEVRESLVGSTGLYVLFDPTADVRFPRYRVSVAVTRPDGSRSILEASAGIMTVKRDVDERVALFFAGLTEADVPVGAMIELLESRNPPKSVATPS